MIVWWSDSGGERYKPEVLIGRRCKRLSPEGAMEEEGEILGVHRGPGGAESVIVRVGGETHSWKVMEVVIPAVTEAMIDRADRELRIMMGPRLEGLTDGVIHGAAQQILAAVIEGPARKEGVG
jgi:hypothetical protein